MILSPSDKWFSNASSAEASYYEVLPQSTYTLTVSDIPDDATIKWFEGGYRDENKVQSEMRWYELKSHTKPSMTLSTDNDKFHYVEVNGEVSDLIFIKVLTYEQIIGFHKCYGKYGMWCKSCGAECYVEDGPPELDVVETPYRPGPDLSNEQGVEHGYDEPDSVPIKQGRIDLKSIIIKAQNILKMWVESTFLDPHLNPTVDNTEQVDELFNEYGLDITTIEGQDTFHELQTFEKKNSAEAANMKEKAALLEPFNDALCCLQNEINTYKPIVWARAPHIFFTKFQLVKIYTEQDEITFSPENYFKKASSFNIYDPIIYSVDGESDYDEYIDMNECQGVLLRVPRYRGELLPIMTCGVIKGQHPWEGIPGQKIRLGESGIYDSEIPNPESSYDRNTCYYQELGFQTEDGFCFQPQQHILRRLSYEEPS